jgi:hypothetical protein
MRQTPKRNTKKSFIMKLSSEGRSRVGWHSFNQTKVVTRRNFFRKCKKPAGKATTRTLMNSYQKKTGPNEAKETKKQRILKIVKQSLRFIQQVPMWDVFSCFVPHENKVKGWAAHRNQPKRPSLLFIYLMLSYHTPPRSHDPSSCDLRSLVEIAWVESFSQAHFS